MFIALLKKINIATTVLLLVAAGGVSLVIASSTSNFTQVINPGSLSADIVDASYASVVSPTMAMPATNFSFLCHTITGSFGTTSQQIYVQNPDAADNGWSLDLAASAPTAVWSSAGTPFDFNEASSTGCADGSDTDSVAGKMTVDASVGTLTTGACSTCTTDNITKGSSASFSEGVLDSINLLTAAAASDNLGDWKLTDVRIDQKIPAEQPVASDYNINMVLSATAI